MDLTRPPQQQSTTPQPAPTQGAAHHPLNTQLKEASFEQGSALLTPVQAKGGITIGAHKNAPPPAPKGPSGIVIGAHKGAAPQGGGATGGGAQSGGQNQTPGPSGGFVAGAPKGGPGKAGGPLIGGHKQPPPAEAGAATHGPPNKPLPPTPGQANTQGGPPNKPLPPIPGQPGAQQAGANAGQLGQLPPGSPGAPTQAPDPAALEQQAEEDDKASFYNVDGNVAFFENEGKVASYFNSWSPSAWRAVHPADWHASRLAAAQKGVNDMMLNALIGYTGPGYSPMNRLTRGQMKSKRFANLFKPHSAAASAAIDKLKTKDVKNTQRGWRTIPKGDDKLIEGLYKREFVDEKGFMSTTTNTQQGFFAGPVSIQIAGKGGIDVGMFSVSPSEGEILYAPNTRFKVTRFQRNSDVEPQWRQWHQNQQSMKPPPRPWFEVDLEEK